MKIIEAYKVGWRKAFSNKKMWGLLYLLNFVIVLFAVIPFSGFLTKTIGDSLASLKMLKGFDYALITEFMREYEAGVSVILNLSIGIALLYFLFSIFMTGGILSVLKNEEKFSSQNFWQSSSIYFWKFLRLTFYFLIIHFALLGFFGYIFLRNGISPFELENEMVIIRSLMIIVPIYLFFATIFFTVQDYAKVQIIHSDDKFIHRSILDAFRFVFKNFRNVFGLYLLNLLTFLAFFGIQFLLKSTFEANTFGTILILFLIGQFFIISRIGVRLVNYGSSIFLFQNIEKRV